MYGTALHNERYASTPIVNAAEYWKLSFLVPSSIVAIVTSMTLLITTMKAYKNVGNTAYSGTYSSFITNEVTEPLELLGITELANSIRILVDPPASSPLQL